MISSPDRKQAIDLIEEAHTAGARYSKACEVLGITVRTLQHWSSRASQKDGRQVADKRVHHNRLDPKEEDAIINRLNQPDVVNKTIPQAYYYLLDRNVYLASISTIYRIFRRRKLNVRRDTVSKSKHHAKPSEFTADGTNQVWTWDITYFRDARYPTRWFYAYVVTDLYSRLVIRDEVHEADNSEYAAAFLEAAIKANGCPEKLVLHSDNGASMKAAKTLAVLQRHGVTFSHSRPHVSNDNPFAESFFRTLKYTGERRYPHKGFQSLAHAQGWLDAYVAEYNEGHYHRGIGYVTPGSRFRGEDKAILANRCQILERARRIHPDRWIQKRTAPFAWVPSTTLNPDKATA